MALTICMVMGLSVGISTKANADFNNGWINTNRGWNYYENGSIKTGWLKDNEAWCLNENGAMVSNTTINRYYLEADGAWLDNASGNETIEGESNFKDVTMKSDKSTYELGTKEIKVDITNNSKQDVYYGLQYEVENLKLNKIITMR